MSAVLPFRTRAEVDAELLAYSLGTRDVEKATGIPGRVGRLVVTLEHGRQGYGQGCRCDECRADWSAYKRDLRQARKGAA